MKATSAWLVAASAAAASWLAAALLPIEAAAQGAPQMQFRTERIPDPQQNNITIATISVPVQWRVTSQVRWNYNDVSQPIRWFVRVESPDRSAWLELFPIELFYWLDPVRSPVAVGGRSLGMVHAPGIKMQDALRNYVIAPYRGRNPNLQVVNASALDPARLTNAFGQPAVQGEAAMVKVRYTFNGQPAEEDFYGILSAPNRIAYTGGQGTSYEWHRVLLDVHSIGATNGQLQSMYPLLGYIATSIRVDPAWEQHRKRVQDTLNALFNAEMARGASQIAAAGAASRAISANNDAMLGSMQAARAAQAQRDAAQRASAGAAGGSDGFSQYIRGTEKMKDPYWGESEQSSASRYHWTDGSGNYRSSNDPGFNPNIGTGGGVTWQRMEPAR